MEKVVSVHLPLMPWANGHLTEAGLQKQASVVAFLQNLA